MTAIDRVHGSGSRTLLTVVGLGTAAMAGAAIALAVSSPPSGRARRSMRRRAGSAFRPGRAPSDLVDTNGSGLFV